MQVTAMISWTCRFQGSNILREVKSMSNQQKLHIQFKCQLMPMIGNNENKSMNYDSFLFSSEIICHLYMSA